MKGIYFIFTRYKTGRVSIRDKPYPSLAAAKRALTHRQAKLAGNPAVMAVQISYQNVSAIADIDVKNIIAI